MLLQLMRLLGNHCLQEGLILLHAGSAAASRRQAAWSAPEGAVVWIPHGEAHISQMDRLPGKLADILLLEGRQLGVLLVEVSL